MGAVRTHRDRAMVAAMVLGGLRRCEVLGLRLDDLRVAERRVFIAEGKGGHQRLVPRCRCRTRSQTAGTLGDEPAAGVTIVFSRVFVRRRQPPACKKEPIQRLPNAARARSIV
jgi:integrase